MAEPHAKDVSGCEWFHTARVLLRVGSGGEGGSSPKAGGEEGESVSIELHSGRHVYFIGAMGETSLKKVQVKAAQGDSAAAILRILAGLWKGFRLAKMNSKLYWQAYYLMRGNGDVSLVWSFTSVVLACDDAKKRQQLIPAMVRVAGLFAVVLTGLAFLTVNGQCTMLLPGVAHFICPRAPVRVEVEGHTVVLLAYSVDRASGESLTKTSAKRRASDLVHAKDAAQKVATLRADRARKQKARTKAIPEPALVTDTGVVDHEKEARASPVTCPAPSGSDHETTSGIF